MPNPLFDLWLKPMNDFTKISFQHGARLQSRQLEMLMAMQFRLAESQAKQVMDYWSRLWRST
jgi:hypothetical protein